jgi:CRISPR/Cas system-associated protein Cas7 (RAMP superfamily)
MTDDDLDDYRQRIIAAIGALERLAAHIAKRGRDEDVRPHVRLMGKVEGLKLALDYLRYYDEEGEPSAFAIERGDHETI